MSYEPLAERPSMGETFKRIIAEAFACPHAATRDICAFCVEAALVALRAEAAKVARAIGCTYPYNDLPGTCADNAGNHYGGCPIAVAAKIEAL